MITTAMMILFIVMSLGRENMLSFPGHNHMQPEI